jgi:hypothetical protein
MPVLTFADGTSLSWELTSPAVPDAPLMVDASSTTDASPGTTSLSLPVEPPVSEADVATALARVPPKWTSTALRTGKTLVAGMAAAIGVAWASAGGSWEGLVKDPSAFLTALATAVLMGAWKFFGWRE